VSDADDPRFRVNVSMTADGARLTVEGNLDDRAGPMLASIIDVLIETRRVHVSIDLTGAEHVDGPGYAVLHEARRRLEQRGGTLDVRVIP
jgi:ABC-type transporter Mla MlaB component